MVGRSTAARHSWRGPRRNRACGAQTPVRPSLARGGGTSQTLDDLLNGAQAAAAAGDLIEARRLSELAVAREPRSAAASYVLGAVCLQLEDPTAAVSALQRALAAPSPAQWRAATNLAVALQQLDRWSEAVEAARQAVRLQPRLVVAHIALAQALRGAGRLREALTAAREALGLHDARAPQPAEATCDSPACVLGEILVDSGELEEAWSLAIRAAEEANHAGTAMALACTLAGRVQAAAGQYEKALDALAKSEGLDPERGARPRRLRLGLITRALRSALPAQPGDVFVATFPKSGTTWMQQLVCLLRGDAQDVDIQTAAPYIEAAIATQVFSLATLRSMSSPRIFKTHAAWPSLPVSGCSKLTPPEGAKVVVVVRDPRDVMVSLYYHSRALHAIQWRGSWDEWFEAFLDGTAPLPMATPADEPDGKTDEPGTEKSGHDWFSHTLSWWRVAQSAPSRVLWVRFEEMLTSPFDELRRLSKFLGAPYDGHDDAELARIVQASSFGEMKRRHEAGGDADSLRVAGESGHFRNGRAGDWRSHLSAAQAKRFRSVMSERLAGSGLEGAFEDPASTT